MRSSLLLTKKYNKVQYIFEQKVQKWFRDKMKDRNLQMLYDAVLSRECDRMEEEINGIFQETISYMDQNEYYYHGMLAGLLTGMKGYTVRSNREGGKGRSELQNDGYRYVSCYGIAFCGKECAVCCRAY